MSYKKFYIQKSSCYLSQNASLFISKNCPGQLRSSKNLCTPCPRPRATPPSPPPSTRSRRRSIGRPATPPSRTSSRIVTLKSASTTMPWRTLNSSVRWILRILYCWIYSIDSVQPEMLLKSLLVFLAYSAY